jgi:AraC-like DNA-binding protein
MREKSEIKISARKTKELIFEKYEYSSGAVEPLRHHAHSEYQFSTSPNAVGEYLYRGGRHKFAPLTLAVIHSGERHAPSDRVLFDKPESYAVMYAAPEELLSAAKEIGWQKNELPYFKNLLITDQILIKRFLRLFDFSQSETPLSEDTAKLDFLTYLTGNFAQNKKLHPNQKKNPDCVKLAREYLDANFADAVSLDNLARIARVGKYYLCREFQRIVGFSPHQYQNQLRINSARQLLLQNRSLADISHELGYYDQSHFGKYFKQQVGISPGFYSAGATFS